MRNRTGWTLALACVLIISNPARSRGQAANTGKDGTRSPKAMVEEAVGWYGVFKNAGAAEAMTPHRVLRWHNATRGTQESDGIFVLWVNKGRPEASASIYPWEGDLYHVFASVSRDAKLVARDSTRVIWSPETPGVQFKDIPGAPAPADTPAARLKQMKVLADRFKVTMTGWKPDKSDREELRLLPKPLYRYELDETTGTDPGWIDGVVLGFVSGTDPEAILLLEAVRIGGHARWQYAFARATAAGLEGRLDQTVVWELDFLEGHDTPLRPDTTLRRPLGTAAPKRGAASSGQ
jgi:hypothetical protein